MGNTINKEEQLGNRVSESNKNNIVISEDDKQTLFEIAIRGDYVDLKNKIKKWNFDDSQKIFSIPLENFKYDKLNIWHCLAYSGNYDSLQLYFNEYGRHTNRYSKDGNDFYHYFALNCDLEYMYKLEKIVDIYENRVYEYPWAYFIMNCDYETFKKIEYKNIICNSNHRSFDKWYYYVKGKSYEELKKNTNNFKDASNDLLKAIDYKFYSEYEHLFYCEKYNKYKIDENYLSNNCSKRQKIINFKSVLSITNEYVHDIFVHFVNNTNISSKDLVNMSYDVIKDFSIYFNIRNTEFLKETIIKLLEDNYYDEAYELTIYCHSIGGNVDEFENYFKDRSNFYSLIGKKN